MDFSHCRPGHWNVTSRDSFLGARSNQRNRSTFPLRERRHSDETIGGAAGPHCFRVAAKMTLSGGCLCGRVRFNVRSEPRVHYCHCDMCRRATGSAFAVLAWVPSQSLTWTGAEPNCRRSSPIAQRGFCSACGSPLSLTYDASPNEVALHVGTFDDPASLQPHYNYGSSQRLSWVCCGIDLPDHDTEERW
ncbi:GFA family protein [Mesorhizobium sp. NZP2298]|nr:GFA family protein [Mesorhizobium sp. NZP2298]